MIEAYLTIAGVVILIGIVLMFFEGGSSKSSQEPEKRYTEDEMFEMTYKPFLVIFRFFGIKTWNERKKEFKKGKEPGWFDKISLWMEGNNEK